MEAPLQFQGDRIELLHSPSCRKRRLMEEGGDCIMGLYHHGENLRPKVLLWRQGRWFGPAGTLGNYHHNKLDSALTTFKFQRAPCLVGVSIAPLYPAAFRGRREEGVN